MAAIPSRHTRFVLPTLVPPPTCAAHTMAHEHHHPGPHQHQLYSAHTPASYYGELPPSELTGFQSVGPVYAHPGPSSAGALPAFAHGHSQYVNPDPGPYNSYASSQPTQVHPQHSPAAPQQFALPPHPSYYDGNDTYSEVMQRPYMSYPPAEPRSAQFAQEVAYPVQSPSAQSPLSLPIQSQGPAMGFAQPKNAANPPNRNYYRREALEKLYMHPHAHRAMSTVPSQSSSTPSVHSEPLPSAQPANTYPFVPIVPGPHSGPVLAPQLQQSLAYPRSPASILPSTLPAVPSTSGPSSSRQSDSAGSISPRTNQDNSLPAPVFSSTSPVVNRGDILLTDPSARNRKYVIERDIACIKVREIGLLFSSFFYRLAFSTRSSTSLLMDVLIRMHFLQ